MSKSSPNKTSTNIKVHTWRGQIIEIGENLENIFINVYSVPWIFEILIWYFPIFLLLFFSALLGSLYPIIVIMILFIVMPISGILGKDIGFSYWSRILSKFYSYIGRKEQIIILKDRESEEEEHFSLDNKKLFRLSQITGIGYIGEIKCSNSYYSQGYFLYARICLIINHMYIIPLGGMYGSFLTGNNYQKHQFEILYLALSRILKFPILFEPSTSEEVKIYYNHYKISRNNTIASFNYKFQFSYKFTSLKDNFSMWDVSLFFIPEMVSFVLYSLMSYLTQIFNVNNKIIMSFINIILFLLAYVFVASFFYWLYHLSRMINWEGFFKPKLTNNFTFEY